MRHTRRYQSNLFGGRALLWTCYVRNSIHCHLAHFSTLSTIITRQPVRITNIHVGQFTLHYFVVLYIAVFRLVFVHFISAKCENRNQKRKVPPRIKYEVCRKASGIVCGEIKTATWKLSQPWTLKSRNNFCDRDELGSNMQHEFYNGLSRWSDNWGKRNI